MDLVVYKLSHLQCVYVQLILYMICCRQYLGSKPQASDLVFLFIVSLAAMAAFHKLYPLGIGETDSVVDLQQTLQRDPHLLALYTYEGEFTIIVLVLILF